MSSALRPVLLLLALLMQPPAHADAAADWSRIALDAALAAGAAPECQLRAIALVNLAMLEAANFVAARHPSQFIVVGRPLAGLSPDAAAAAAAHHLLSELYPEYTGEVPAALDQRTPQRPPTREELVAGSSVAAVILAVTPRACPGPAEPSRAALLPED